MGTFDGAIPEFAVLCDGVSVVVTEVLEGDDGGQRSTPLEEKVLLPRLGRRETLDHLHVERNPRLLGRDRECE